MNKDFRGKRLKVIYASCSGSIAYVKEGMFTNFLPTFLILDESFYIAIDKILSIEII